VRTYLVFEPATSGRNETAAELVRFVREKFYWSALFFAPVWLLWHALWVGFVCWLLAEAILAILGYMLGLDPSVTAVLLWLPSFVVAFEGAELRRRKLLRSGYRDAGVAVGATLEDAEYRFFTDWISRATALPGEDRIAPAVSARTGAPAVPGPVIGLFPQPGGRP
jgi:hypothetical protein